MSSKKRSRSSDDDSEEKTISSKKAIRSGHDTESEEGFESFAAGTKPVKSGVALEIEEKKEKLVKIDSIIASKIKEKKNLVTISFPAVEMNITGHSNRGIEMGEKSNKLYLRLEAGSTGYEKYGEENIHFAVEKVRAIMSELANLISTSYPVQSLLRRKFTSPEDQIAPPIDFNLSTIKDLDDGGVSITVFPGKPKIFFYTEVSPYLHEKTKMKIGQLVENTGNSTFRLHLAIKTLGLKFNDETKTIEAQLYLNVRGLTFFSLGQDVSYRKPDAVSRSDADYLSKIAALVKASVSS